MLSPNFYPGVKMT